MSNVSGIGSVGTDLIEYIRQMTNTDSASKPSQVQGKPPGGGDVPEPLWEEIESSAETSGLSTDEIDSLRDELKSAISTAMESVDRSSGPEAGREAIDGAILTTLQDHGIDTTGLEDKMGEMKARMQSMGPPNQGANGAESTSASALLASLTGLSSSDQSTAATLLSSLFPLVDEEA